VKLRNGVEIRHYRPGDEEQLNALFQSIFHIERPIEGWYWKFRDNPLVDLILISVAVTEEGGIVGMYPLLVMEFKVKDMQALAVQLVEISIHPDYRGRWIIKELKRFLQPRTIQSGIKFGFGFPTREHAKVGVRYMDYHILGELPILGICYYKQSPINYRVFRGLFERITSLMGRFRHYLLAKSWIKRDRLKGVGYEVKELSDFDDRFDTLWENISSAYPVITRRSSRYLKWRYMDNPMADFTLLGLFKGHVLKGYMVYTTLEEGGRTSGVIFDFFCGKEDLEVRLLLSDGLLRLLRNGVRSIRCGALPHTQLHHCLVELGFEKWPISPLINFEVLDDVIDESVLGNLDEWYLSLGDTDLFSW